MADARTVFETKSAEGATRFITFTIVDQAGALISSIDSLALTLFDKRTRAIINSLDGSDVLASFAAGTVTYELVPASMVIVNDDTDEETHVALFEWVYSTTRASSHEFEFVVQNFRKV